MNRGFNEPRRSHHSRLNDGAARNRGRWFDEQKQVDELAKLLVEEVSAALARPRQDGEPDE